MLQPVKISDFKAIRLRLASPAVMRKWSYGEITKPETINYRTQKPEKGGLFAEEIFGPTKDWECYCGKYKKIRYKGIICDKCGVEVTRSAVRRERFGHIELAAPVSHIWFLRGVPSRLGTILKMSIQDLERVIYFADFIITKVDEELKKQTIEQVQHEYQSKKKMIFNEFEQKTQRLSANEGEVKGKEINKLKDARSQRIKDLENAFKTAERELNELTPLKIISESAYHDLALKYGHIFEVGIGAEAIKEILDNLDINALVEELEKEVANGVAVAKQEKISRRLKLLKNLKRNGISPSWMILTTIPVIPPELRPMVPLDGGRFATSDLNDLYRRVINRNNRLKQLLELNTPEVICRNEKRMLQEAVDALIDNSARHGKTVVASTGQKRSLKSLADILKGKQGRFRQNLLGKRVDYSGRSVIVVGPHLKLDQCGIPKKMALELFKPFIMSELIKREVAHNIRSASRYIETGSAEVWDILESITSRSYVLLNRAPTLHRLSIQAFRPILIEGLAIQLHPMVCSAFNADFDGDQMAVHVPLTKEAQEEAAKIMLSTENLIKPATGDPIATPNQDVVWGCYYLTRLAPVTENSVKKIFSSPQEAILAYQTKIISLHQPIRVSLAATFKDASVDEHGLVLTTVGRIIFNRALPKDLDYQNDLMDKKKIGRLVRLSLDLYGNAKTAQLLDDLKNLAFEYLTRSGLSWGMGDLPELPAKDRLIEAAEKRVEETHAQYEVGLLTASERHAKIIEIWTEVKDRVMEISKQGLNDQGSVFSMIDSGARGSWGQLTQIVGMKGLVTNPIGDIIELPVKGNFKRGFGVLEYFISTHGARKGLSDTALRTANAGYLTRRLVDVSQDVVIKAEDCGDDEGYVLYQEDAPKIGKDMADRLLQRVVLDDIKSATGKKVLVKAGTRLTPVEVAKIRSLNLNQARVRSLVFCKLSSGVCAVCYGQDLGKNKPVALGTAVGIIAAQSIGEPGTQLTMRTFHTGGVVGLDITQGLPRVEELFEVRPPKKKSFIAMNAGQVKILAGRSDVQEPTKKTVPQSARRGKIIQVIYEGTEEEIHEVSAKGKIKVKNNQEIKAETLLFIHANGREELSRSGGRVIIQHKAGAKGQDIVKIVFAVEKIDEYEVPFGYVCWVKDGELASVGQQLTEGSNDLNQLYQLRSKEVVQRYIINEILHIYSSQGQKLDEKHVELIVRQMFSRVQIIESGDTDLLAGEIVETLELDEENARIKKEKGRLAVGKSLLLGITKISLTTKSWLSAASFQETARVLINAAVTGKIDHLEGLKENVIIGRLIPVGTGFHAAAAKAKKKSAK